MQYIGIDLHTNRFACCYLSDDPKGKRMATFDIDEAGLKQFSSTLSKDTHILVESTINTFAFIALFKDLVKEILAANTYRLKSVGIPGKKTDKIDATKLAEKLKAQVVSGVSPIVPVTVPPKETRSLRSLFAACRALRKEIGRTENRIHSLLKENLCPFAKEYVFGKKSRETARGVGRPGSDVSD
jgi:transposase